MLTSFGRNFDPEYSMDGTKVYFSSESRPLHKNAQIYELDLITKSEKQITHNDGVNRFPKAAAHTLIYTSTTDEIKEYPDFARLATNQKIGPEFLPESLTNKSNELPFEIYMSRKDGNIITRITRNKGFDGYPHFQEFKRKIRILFLRRQEKRSRILSVQLNGRRPRTRVATKNDILSFSASRNGQILVWLEKLESKTTQIKVQERRKTRTIPIPEDINPTTLNLFPKSSRIIFSGIKENNKDLYVTDFKGCVNRITYSNANDQQPKVSPDEKFVIFASDRNEGSQIFTLKLPQFVACGDDASNQDPKSK